MNRTPLLIVGDGPQEPTGLGRIARDLAGLVAQSDLPLDLVQVGGLVPPVWSAWRHYPLDPRNDDWGVSQVEAYWRHLWGDEPGILWVIWDPSRLYAYLQADLPVQRWAYTAIDSVNIRDSIGGPAAEGIAQFDRVLAYGRWASKVVRTIRDRAQYLPHGIHLSTYVPSSTSTEQDDAWVRRVLGPHVKDGSILVGCVATNQPRKDLSLFFYTLAALRDRGKKVYGWLHTDVLVKAWSVQQLVADFALAKQVTVTTETFIDRQMALLYQACDITLGVGLGEGFGYAAVESLASGVPHVHGDFGGGAELIPKREWRPPVRELRLESVYALKRPVYRAADFANAIERVLEWRGQVGEATAAAYCRGAVAHLDWPILAPRWLSWIKGGL